jgi:short-subunit dehydrogenase
VAKRLAAEGAEVVLVARNASDLAAVVKEIEVSGGKAAAFPLDLADIGALPEALRQLIEQWGPFHISIHNAGMGYTANALDTPLSDWQAVLNLNLTAAFACLQAVLPGMRQLRQGHIVNVVSIAGKQAFPGWSAYCASKFGLLGLSKAVAQEEREHGIRVTVFCPGAVDSPLWDSPSVNADFDRSRMLSVETVVDSLVYTLSLPANAVVEELVLMPSRGAF